jgi:hypothetical protein
MHVFVGAKPSELPCASSHASLRLSYAHIPLATCSLLPTLEDKVAVVLLRRLSMMSSKAHEQPTERDPETLYIDLATTPAVQERISKLASLLGTAPYLQSIKKVEDGLFAFNLTPELTCLRDEILNIVSQKHSTAMQVIIIPQDHQDTVAKTSAAFRFRDLKPKEAAYRYTAVLLMCKATLYTNSDQIFYIQQFPVNSQVYEAVNRRVREIDPEIEIHSVTNDKTMLLQSRTAPSRKAEATMHSGSVCLVLQNVRIEMVEPLVPFLLIPRFTSKV